MWSRVLDRVRALGVLLEMAAVVWRGSEVVGDFVVLMVIALMLRWGHHVGQGGDAVRVGAFEMDIIRVWQQLPEALPS